MNLTNFTENVNSLISTTFTEKEKDFVTKTLNLLSAVYHKVNVHNKDIYLDKLFDLVKIVLKELHLNSESLIALILFNVKKFEDFDTEFIENQYNKRIAAIIEGISKINEIQVQRITEETISREMADGSISHKKLKEREKERVAVQTENYITLMLTLADDVRSILVKLAMVLFDMRNLDLYKEEIQRKIATETSVIYAPIAHRLGLYAIKTELEDLSMKKLHNEMYLFIQNKLNEDKDSREQFIKDFIAPIQQFFDKNGYKISIKGRPKSIYSIWNKMQKQKTTFEKIYDLFAIRIILKDEYFKKANSIRDNITLKYKALYKINESEIGLRSKMQEEINMLEKELDTEIRNAKLIEKRDCWDVYSNISNWYETNPNRLRDWISNPKESSGYESLHTTVAVPNFDRKWVEIQIRTQRMDEVAEKGQAAHWKYKSTNAKSNTDAWLEKIRTILENTDENLAEKISSSKAELYTDTIFVFTPKGDLKKLSLHATLLDFAYAIHTKVGDTCTGGIVNDKHHKSLKYEVQNGDKIEIKTSPNQKPSVGWLEIANTTRALKKIQLTLKESEYKDAAAGKDMLLYKFKQLKVEFIDETLMKICNELNLRKIIDLYQALGEGKVEITSIKEILDKLKLDEKNVAQRQHRKIEDDKFEKRGGTPEEEASNEYLLIGDNVKGLDFELAKCCTPVFGDNIFGFITIGKGTRIHKVSCPNAAEMMSRYPYRVVKAQWNTKKTVYEYMSDLIITGINSVGIVSNITSLIKKENGIDLHSINVDAKDGMFKGKLTLFAKSKKEFDRFAKTIKSIKGILNVQ